VKYSYADHQFFANYVPMVSDTFWSKLTDADRKLMRDTWAANADRYRGISAKSQADARETMKSHGVTFVDPSPAQSAAARKRMIDAQADLIRDAKLSPEVVKLVTEAVGSNG
jgi:TRAP-type C4-dicarboxylate transport system substrate-binding protein